MANGEQGSENKEAAAKQVGRRRAPARSEAAPRLSAAVGDARQSIESMIGDWRDLVDEHPWRALGLALGAGYIAGGGLFTPLTGRLLYTGLKMGFKVAALPLLREELSSLFDTVTDRGRG
jgi:ElaB/YqjD/DUF883 family membrane-anchored ribosome-binding protein